VKIRDFSRSDDLPAVRACLIELQEHERALDPRVPSGPAMADAYLEGLFQRCDRSDGQLFIAEVAGQVVGYVSVLATCRSDAPDDDPAPFAYVDDLVVLPSHRGRGYGGALLGRAEAYAASRGRSAVRLRVKGGNGAARAFYARAGYAEYEVELEKRLAR
jgi:ribosomal protein S18 acetylase RimI-like enzyme